MESMHAHQKSTGYYPDVHRGPQILISTLHLAENLSVLSQPFKYGNIWNSEKNLQPLVLHLFVMVDLQGGRIYLKIRTSSKSREVLSTFQPNRAVRFRCHEQNYSWFWTRLLSPYRRVVKLGTNTAQRVFVKTQRGHVDLTECLEELGCHEQHIWDEQNVTNLKNGQQRLRKDTTRSCPHQTQGNFDK